MEEARAVRDLARGNIGGFLRHEARRAATNRAVREENMAANSAMGFGPGFRGRRHRHPRHYGRPGFGVAGGLPLPRGRPSALPPRVDTRQTSECTEHLTKFTRRHPQVSLSYSNPRP